jgi:aminoglycoside phosphotransferase (APT) family kinase protein
MNKPAREVNDEEVRRHEASALEIASRRFGGVPNAIEYKATGASNFVFVVSYPQETYVIRMSPEAERLEAYHKEQWVSERARARGVPTAEVIEIAVEDGCPFMIVRRVEGTEGTHHPERLSTLQELGRYARLIHSIPTHGFGGRFDWSPPHQGRNENWAAFLTRELDIDKRLVLLEGLGILNTQQVGALRETLLNSPELSGETALVHGDLRLKNVIVNEEGRINAIIDWEQAMSLTPPYWELAIALHDLSIDAKEAFLRGYGLTDNRIAEITPILRAINIINYAPVIEQAAQNNDTQQIEQFRTRLNGGLDLYGV